MFQSSSSGVLQVKSDGKYEGFFGFEIRDFRNLLVRKLCLDLWGFWGVLRIMGTLTVQNC